MEGSHEGGRCEYRAPGAAPTRAIPIPARQSFGSSDGGGFKPFVDFRVGWAQALVVQFVSLISTFPELSGSRGDGKGEVSPALAPP